MRKNRAISTVFTSKELGQHRIIWQEDSAGIFAPIQSLKNGEKAYAILWLYTVVILNLNKIIKEIKEIYNTNFYAKRELNSLKY